jgi:response regulator RpfG family c-di-GMP phosphodiesterase
MIIFGKEMYSKGMEIIQQLEELINRFPDMSDAIIELPYPRFSSLAHSVNCAIYALIFSRYYRFENAGEIALAALLHNIGFSELDQSLFKRNEYDLHPDELKEYKNHPQLSMDLLKRKFLPFTPLIEQIITSHHENYDGTGFPDRLEGKDIPLPVALVSLIGSFDYFNTVKPNGKPISVSEAWLRLRDYHNDSTSQNRKFNPSLIVALDEFFINNFRKNESPK